MNVLNVEPVLRMACFTAVLGLMSLAEVLAPCRRNIANKRVRWLSNLALTGLNVIALRVLVPLGATGIAIAVQDRGWGILNVVPLPAWVSVLIAIIALDLVIYLQHVMFHAVPALWRLHMVHHADLDFDVTTGVRFHTIEILLSLAIKSGAVAVIGAPPMGVLAFEILLNATSMFSHSNICLPHWLDHLLRFVVVTPDMHRVHHSCIANETNSNFGFNLPWWDLLLGTYRAQPAEGHERMTIGLTEFRDTRVTKLHWMLILPFVRPPGKDCGDPKLRLDHELSGESLPRESSSHSKLVLQRDAQLEPFPSAHVRA